MAFGTLNEEMKMEDGSGSDDNDLEGYQDPQGDREQGDEGGPGELDHIW